MRFKAVIAIIFLFSHVLGVAHDIVPHDHEEHHSHDNAQEHHHHSHTKTIAHSHDGGHSHEHVVHQSHKGFYDFLVCFLQETDHGSKSCENEQYVVPNEFNLLKTKQQVQLLAVLSSFLVIPSVDQKSGFTVNSEAVTSNWVHRVPLLRGPPQSIV